MAHHFVRACAAAVVVAGIAASGVRAQDAVHFSQEQLEQMVSPIALYPDSLVGQMLMASTYPVEVVEADRWLGQQGGADATTIDDGLQNESWDPSVKALVKVPEVLREMSQYLDWTRDLGDAFLGQEPDLLRAVQKMRKAAYDAGNLTSTGQQTVTVESDGTIVIEQAQPETLYVPDYSTDVYGSGWAYSESYYPYMYRPGIRMLAFGAGIGVGNALWGHCDWRRGDVDIDVNRYNSFNQFTSKDFMPLGGARQNWQHDANHRGGVGYRDPAIAQTYHQPGASNRARGRANADAGGARADAGAQRPAAQPAHPGAGQGVDRSHGERRDYDGGLSGASTPRSDRAASQRGSQSRGQAGGGARPAGGRGGGGRGGGRR